MSDKLTDLRCQIDQLDKQLLELISARAKCASEVGEYKRTNDGDNHQFYRPEREANVLRKIADQNQGPLSDEEMARLFREIMSACLALERQLNIAFLGPEGTYTEEAALKHFGHSVQTSAINSIGEVFREVESGAANYGVVPIENSTEGVVTHTLDMFMQSDLRICGEISLRIQQNLMGKTAGLSAVKRVYSHQQSLAQCRRWLSQHLPHAEQIAVSSNSEASRLCAEDQGAMAIGPKQAAHIYGLEVIQAGIEDSASNTTRFLVIGDQVVGASGRDKTSLLVSTPNRPGSLFDILKPLAANGLDMTRIESRPARNTNWDYMFFLDVHGHEQDAAVAGAVELLRKDVDLVRVLGSYPVAVV